MRRNKLCLVGLQLVQVPLAEKDTFFLWQIVNTVLLCNLLGYWNSLPSYSTVCRLTLVRGIKYKKKYISERILFQRNTRISSTFLK